MISSKAKHPNCMYMWMNHIISPKANAAVAEWFGEAPSNPKACAETADKNHCDDLPRRRRGVLRQGLRTGRRRGRSAATTAGDVCKDYSEWVQAWTEIKG